jgi:hypothetical protein
MRNPIVEAFKILAWLHRPHAFVTVSQSCQRFHDPVANSLVDNPVRWLLFSHAVIQHVEPQCPRHALFQAAFQDEAQRETIISDQDRLRENLKSAPQGSDLARLYAQKMLTQENALDKLDSDIKDVRERYEQARKLLGDKVRTFKS